MTDVESTKEGMKRAEILIGALADDNLGQELHGRLRDWLLAIPEDGVAERALAVWAARNIKPETSTPDAKETENFRKLIGSLGISGAEETPEILEAPSISATPESEYRIAGRPAAVESKRKTVFTRRLMSRAAAVLVPILIAAGGAFVVLDRLTVESDTVLHANGEAPRETFTLPDGSNVTLEHGSTLTYSGDFVSERSAELDGEAFFDVVHDTGHPFSVRNQGMNIVVLGTRFNVKARDDTPGAEIILVSGRVAVELGDSRTELAPEDKLVLDKSKLTVLEHSRAGAGAIMRATRSELVIDDIHAVEALRIVADYFEKDLVLSPGLRTEDRLNIVLPNDSSLETAVMCLNALAETVKCHISDDTIYAYPK